MSSVEMGIASNQRQFVGYWGYGNPTILKQSLIKTLATTKERDWQICHGFPADGKLAALSAAGLTEADAWVRVKPTCLMLGRQAFGRVSLYWMQIEQVIWFASRLQLLLPLVEKPEISIPALYGYSCFSYIPTPLTPMISVFAVPAGTEQIWQQDASGSLLATQSRQLLDWCQETEQIQEEEEAIAQLQILLKAAIQRQITDIQDQTVGVFLSGGLDSSIVAALLVQAGVKVRAYTLNFGNAGISELIYASQVAEWLKIPLIQIDATPKRIEQALIPTIKALDLPFGDGVTVPLFLLNQVASQETDIVFNGEGGDQLFAGWTNKPLIAASIYQSEHPNGLESFEFHYLQTFHRLWGYEAQVFRPSVYAQIQQIKAQEWLYPALNFTSNRSLLHRLRLATLMLKGAQNIQPRATNLAFAHNLWVRSPFCDLPLTIWTFRLSGLLCLQGACEKYILKRAVESWLPPEIVWRSKRGMGVPLTNWCFNQGWHWLGKWLNPGVLRAEGRWQPHLAATIASGQLSGAIQGRRIGEILWLLIVWQVWRSQILGEARGKFAYDHPFWLPNWLWRQFRLWTLKDF